MNQKYMDHSILEWASFCLGCGCVVHSKKKDVHDKFHETLVTDGISKENE